MPEARSRTLNVRFELVVGKSKLMSYREYVEVKTPFSEALVAAVRVTSPVVVLYVTPDPATLVGIIGMSVARFTFTSDAVKTSPLVKVLAIVYFPKIPARSHH